MNQRVPAIKETIEEKYKDKVINTIEITYKAIKVGTEVAFPINPFLFLYP